MIQDSRFKTKLAWELFHGFGGRGFPPDVARRAQNKLKIVYAAARLEDLRFPPGNRLEPLQGDRAGAWSIRINEQWRICFTWQDGMAWEIDVVDYH